MLVRVFAVAFLTLFAESLFVESLLAQEKVQFLRDIQPILSANCFACHGFDPTTQKAGLRLDQREAATGPLKSGNIAIVPGNPRKSELLTRLHDKDEPMPPAQTGKKLTDAEKKLLERWIAEGAEYQGHWSFVRPQKAALPKTKTPDWARQPIDHFILARLEASKFRPMPAADRYTLARRIALDLTGLPPTIEMVDQFVNDTRPQALEHYVDEVMSLPAFGERWAQVWLDLARYADSNGYAEDQPRTIWKYRDWVIKAINDNMPFDQFTIEQLAGDMLPDATPDQLIATAFHRNTLTNTEGGTNDEEFRNIAIVDRVNTTFQVWMGITINCAQCHNHKYDPITQEEYFQVFDILNQCEDSDKGDNSPNLMYLSPEDAKNKAAWDRELAMLDKELHAVRPNIDTEQIQWEASMKGDAKKLATLAAGVQAILKIEPAKRKAEQKDEIVRVFRATIPEVKGIQTQIDEVKRRLVAVQPVPTPILKELPAKSRRATKVHVRGDWLNLGKQVTAGLPSMFPPLPKGEVANRLGLAKWLVAPDNPLTARVAVNRYWEQIFGQGLVDTPEDFGIRSKPPLHQDLLDWLAVEFATELKWDVKKLLKILVTSAAYQQSSQVTPEMHAADPDNRLFGRGPRYRASAEVIRDQALYVSGLLSPKMYGPSVRPPQPKIGLNAAFGPGTDWTTSSGEDKYRRGLYTYWRRTTPYPSMVTFDAPNRNVCTVSRPRSNTPLQALVTLNDPVYVEAAQALARRMVKEGGDSPESRIAHAFRLCLIRPPHPAEGRRLVELFQRTRSEYAKNSKDAVLMATDPLGPLPTGMDPIDLASYTVVANVLLNLDEVFAKR
jgi:hypothetical protein